MLREHPVPIDLARRELRNCGVAAIVAAERGPNAKTALGKIQAVPRGVAHAVKFNPLDQRLIHSTW